MAYPPIMAQNKIVGIIVVSIYIDTINAAKKMAIKDVLFIMKLMVNDKIVVITKIAHAFCENS